MCNRSTNPEDTPCAWDTPCSRCSPGPLARPTSAPIALSPGPGASWRHRGTAKARGHSADPPLHLTSTLATLDHLSSLSSNVNHHLLSPSPPSTTLSLTSSTLLHHSSHLHASPRLHSPPRALHTPGPFPHSDFYRCMVRSLHTSSKDSVLAPHGYCPFAPAGPLQRVVPGR